MSHFIGSVISSLNLVNGIVALLCTTLHLVQKRKSSVNYLIALIYFLMAWMILYFQAFRSGTIYSFPYLIFSDVAVTFAIGPAFYLYIARITGSAVRIGVKSAALFLPSALAMGYILGLNVFSGKALGYFLTARPQFPRYDVFRPIELLNTAADISIAVYIVLSVMAIRRALKRRRSKPVKGLWFFIHFFTAQMVFMGFLFYGHYTGSDVLIASMSTMIGTMTIILFIFSQRNPEIAYPSSAAIAARGDVTPASGEHDELTGKITALVENERIYRNENLSLQMLSNRLGVSNHVLSSALKSGMGLNFRAYINRCRLEEARELLLSDPDRHILDIAFAVGFNSKTSFNTAFIQENGISPREFRARYLEKRDSVFSEN